MRGKPVPEERPLRQCAECGKTDTGGMHVVVVDFGEVTPDGAVIRPRTVVQRHHECCASIGCYHDADDERHCANVLAVRAGV